MPTKKKATTAQIAGRKRAQWKLERRKKYLKKADTTTKPEAGTRTKIWIPAYKRTDGIKVEGHWRANHHAHKKGNFAKTGVGSKAHHEMRKRGINPRTKK